MSSYPNQIHRYGDTPMYIEYAVMYAITDKDVTPDKFSDEVKKCRADVLKIPNFQRKLVWKEDDVNNAITMKGRLYGNVVLAKLLDNQPSLLIDGLQRLALVTALLNALYDEVLKNPPDRPNEAAYFDQIKNKISNLTVIFLHNHEILLHHSRTGIKESYAKFFKLVKEYVLKKLSTNAEAKQFAEQLNFALLDKQIAIDPYQGFTDLNEIISTFKNMNSTGILLTDIDLLRADIIAHAEAMGWNSDKVIKSENRFTEIFDPTKVNQFTKILGINLYNTFEKNNKDVFPDWDTFSDESLEEFYYYIEKVDLAALDTLTTNETKYKWSYLSEIYRCGALPFASFVWLWYKKHYLKFLDEKKKIQKELEAEFKAKKQPYDPVVFEKIIEDNVLKIELEQKINQSDPVNDKLEIDEIKKKIELLKKSNSKYKKLFVDLPDFLGGDLDTHIAGHRFLRAAYRRVLDDTVGKTGQFLLNVMNGTISSFDTLSDFFNPNQNSGTLDGIPNSGWLKQKITEGDSSRAKIIFNACKLPKRDSQKSFEPFIWRNKNGFWNMDHLIPESNISSNPNANNPGELQVNTAVNFAPLDYNSNNTAKSTQCVQKLSSQNSFYSQIKHQHEYVKWLVDVHYPAHANDPQTKHKLHPLNDHGELIPSSKISTERVNKIYDILSDKL